MILNDIQYETYYLPEEYVFHRATTEEHKNKNFNKTGKGSRRFDPIKESDGTIIGSTYLALSGNVALQETHVRIDSESGKNKCTYIPEDDFSDNPSLLTQIKLITTGAPLSFIDLETTSIDGEALAPFLRLDGKYISIKTKNSNYFATRYAALTLLSNIKGMHGFTWHSYQRGVRGERCFVLFDKWCKDVTFTLTGEIELRSLAGKMALKDAMQSVDAEMYAI